jgi:hypothetical protein
MAKKINVNSKNSKMFNGRLFITGLKMVGLGKLLRDCVKYGSTVKHPVLGMLYEFDGPYSRS